MSAAAGLHPRQARCGEALVELVAGKIDGDEDPLATAQRELGEEVGLQAQGWISLGQDPLPSPGFLNEPIHLFAAWDLTTVDRRDEDAHIQGEWVALKEAIQMVVNHDIRDMKAKLALLLVEPLREKYKSTWEIV